MDEIIVRIARAIASRSRLQILAHLSRVRELTPTALCAELGRARNAVSLDLRTLVSAGLALRRKSGSWCYYSAQSPYGDGTPSGSVTKWLTRLLRDANKTLDHPGLQEVRDGSRNANSALHDLVFEAATAFTDLRRLQVLRYLDTQCRATARTLSSELSMSEQALSRHLAKLRRRGYVLAEPTEGRAVAYALCAVPKSPVHGRLFQIVRATWTEETSRTS